MATTKVKLRFATIGNERGDIIEVDEADADRLVRNGSASRLSDKSAKPAPKSPKD